MILNEVSAVGKFVLQERQAVIIGLSIRNKYFRGNTIEQITDWAKDKCLPIEMAIDIGVQFLIKELSFIIAASEILNLNCPSAYLYHRPLLVHQSLLEGKYKIMDPINSGYIICEINTRNGEQKYSGVVATSNVQ